MVRVHGKLQSLAMKDYNMENAFIATPLSSKLIHVQLLIDFVAGGQYQGACPQ